MVEEAQPWSFAALENPVSDARSPAFALGVVGSSTF